MTETPPKNSLLLIIDVQNDFCSGGGLPVPGGEGIVPLINLLNSAFSSTILT